jgi:murein DD-endopeptidase MepM/ murein hydrolase activator NlpD
MKPSRWPGLLLSSLILISAACTPAAASVRQETPGAELFTKVPLTEPAQELAPQATSTTASLEGAVTPAITQDTAIEASPTAPMPEASGELTPSITPASSTPAPPSADCSAQVCNYTAQYFLMRPVAEPGRNVVDNTYRFGSTQGQMREPHHGVELPNSSGTSVLAAADGVVVVAGDDRAPTSAQGAWPITYYGPYSYFYGNLVVIEHPLPAALLADLPDLPQPIYTLYAHLSQVNVEPGQPVKAGQQIGAVGMSGIAEGSHLHFEVRLGENTYESVRNPELWLAPRLDEVGQPMGGIAGRVVDAQGNEVVISEGIVLQRLPGGPQAPHDLEFYLMTYEEPALIGQPPWRESFAIGDLPAGLYRLTFAYQGVRQYLVEVLPGQLSVATLQAE